ncbi:MAG: DUF5344 family protein [Acutalibacteraceae bacterium]|nr:DUF5344 family protein [Acutalibacteraceae bacterium]
MSEIKVNKVELSLQLNALSLSGTLIDTDVSGVTSEGVETLTTSLKYIEQHKQIAELMDLYKQLVIKDAAEIKAAQNAFSSLDSTVSRSFENTLMNMK